MSFIFKGISSDKYGIAREINIPVFPPIKTSIVEMPCRDGDIDFTGSDGIMYYEDTIFTIELQIFAKNSRELKQKMREIGNWLNGSGTLIDNDGISYNATCYEGLNYQPELDGRFAKITINFRISTENGW